MALTRAQFENELVPGLNSLIGLTYVQYGEQYKQIVDTYTSKRSFEEEQKLIGLGRAQYKDEGASVAFDEGAGEAWKARYTHKTYALGFILTQEAMEDNLYDSIGSRYSEELGKSMKLTKEYEVANLLNLAFNSSFTGGDGVSLCNAAHPTAAGINNSNYMAVGADLNEATLEAAINQMAQWVNERGWLIAAKPKKLIIPVGLQFVARRLLSSPYRPGTSDNDVNAMKDMDSIPGGYVVNNYLTDPDAWFIKTSVRDGLKMFQRVGLEKKNEGDFNTGNAKFKARERYSIGWTDPLGVYGSAGAT